MYRDLVAINQLKGLSYIQGSSEMSLPTSSSMPALSRKLEEITLRCTLSIPLAPKQKVTSRTKETAHTEWSTRRLRTVGEKIASFPHSSQEHSYRLRTAMKTSNVSRKKNANLLQDGYKQTDGEIINRRLFGQLLGIKQQREE